MIPIKYAHSKKLISHDSNSNTYNYVISLELMELDGDGEEEGIWQSIA